MNGLETVSETEIFQELEFEPELPCESPSHYNPDTQMGHIPEQPGSIYILRGCCGTITAMCEGSVERLGELQRGEVYWKFIWCMVCEERYVDPNAWVVVGPVGKL